MSLKYGVLSLLIFFAIFLLVFKNYETWTLPVEVLPETGATKKSVQKTESPPTGVGQKELTDIQSYILISEKNIFSPDRKEFPVALSPFAESVKKPIVRPQIVLYGVTLAGDYQSASIVNPGRPLKKGERETMSVKVGDQIGEFKVVKILLDRIVMEAAEDSFEVLLYDAKSPKQRTYAKTEAKSAAVTTTLPTPATPAPPPSPGTQQPIEPAQAPAPPPSRIRRGVSSYGQSQPDVAPQPLQPNVPPQSGAPPVVLPVGPS